MVEIVPVAPLTVSEDEARPAGGVVENMSPANAKAQLLPPELEHSYVVCAFALPAAADDKNVNADSARTNWLIFK
jgi:hypothetical protein